MTVKDLVPLIEYVPSYCSSNSRRQIVQVKINGSYAFQQITHFPPIFGWMVGDNTIRTYYLLSPEGITVDWWLAHGAEQDWLWENPYGEGYWCTVPEEFEKAVNLEFALRAMDNPNEQAEQETVTTTQPPASQDTEQWKDSVDEDGTDGIRDGGNF